MSNALAQSFSPTKQTVSVIAERAEIDASTRMPVLLFFASALLWLLLGSVFAFVASWKMHEPEWLTAFGALNWGRLRPAHLNTVIYGWASQAGLGVAIWLLARLCRVKLMNGGLLVAAVCFWNIGVTIGILGILFGHSTGVEWMEMPLPAAFMLFVAYALVSMWAVVMFRFRAPGHVYVSEWYLLAALFWFPWLYGTASMLLFLTPVQGVVQGAINWWFAHNVLGLWFTPIGLAAAYYFIPKVIGRPVHSYYLSALGFWTLALFYSWNGMHHLIGGPFPAWMITASVVASFMMVIPVIAVAINHHMTMVGHFKLLGQSPTLRFVVFGAMAYTAVSLQGVSMAIRSWNQVTHFTHYTVGHAHLGMYGFFTMIMFGAMYYIVPRLVGCEWRSSALIKWHFWLAAYGIILMSFSLMVGGLIQGIRMENPETPGNSFIEIMEGTLPYLRGRSLAGILMTTAHAIFAYHFFLMLLKLGREAGSPTLFTTSEKKEAVAV
ncbi:MAG: cbb3-type cytochrome c oxidase subunit I [Verrucomicrobiales bacterium]